MQDTADILGSDPTDGAFIPLRHETPMQANEDRGLVAQGTLAAAMTSNVELTVIIPAYNEAGRLAPTLDAVRTYLYAQRICHEVLVVDDGSSDGTAALVRLAAAAWPELRLIQLHSNHGKGSAVRVGMLAARGQLRLFSDADMSTSISELPKLEAQIGAGADIAIASRALSQSQVQRHQPAHREWMGRLYNLVLRWTVLPGLRDTQCGFKLFSAAAAEITFRDLECERFGFDAEVLVRASLAGLSVAEVGVVWRDADGTRVNALRDSSQMLTDIWKLRRQLHQRAPRQSASRQRIDSE